MFDVANEPLDTPEAELKLIALGQAMIDPDETEGTDTVKAGYTYFGQFIDHDLTRDKTLLQNSATDPLTIVNYRTPYLDLEHLYCGGPITSPQLYDPATGPDRAEFRIDQTEDVKLPSGQEIKGSAHDVPRNCQHVAETMSEDDRSVENLLLMQMHVVFMKFHNETIRQLSSAPPGVTGIENLGPGTLFTRAQRLVQWHYQYLVRNDFLFRILDPAVDMAVRQRGPSFIWPRNDFFMPIEFSLAAFRFGHSLVRNKYSLNCHSPHVGLSELSRLSRTPARLKETSVIEWGRFFPGFLLLSSGALAPSMPINTAIASELHNLPTGILRLFNPGAPADDHKELPVRTLLRGARSQLASAQQVAADLQAKRRLSRVLAADELSRATNDKSGPMLKACGLTTNTPLFYYVLKEAEILAAGKRLGPLGSQIIADVIEGALRDDNQSYLRCVGPNWVRPLWQFPDGRRRCIDTMSDLVELVDNYVPPLCQIKFPANILNLYPWLKRFVAGLIDFF